MEHDRRLSRLSRSLGSAVLDRVVLAGAGMGCKGGKYAGIIVGGSGLDRILSGFQSILPHHFHAPEVLALAGRIVGNILPYCKAPVRTQTQSRRRKR